MKILYSKIALVGLVCFVSCKSTNIEPIPLSQSESVAKEFLNPADANAVTAFLTSLTHTNKAARTTDEQLADYYNNLGVAYDLAGNYKDAIHYHTQALNLRRTLTDQTDIAKSSNNLAIVHYIKGNYAEAFSLYNQAVVLFHSQNKTQWEAHTLRNYAQALQAQQVYVTAREKYTAALQLWQALGNATQVALLQQDIDTLNARLGAKIGSFENLSAGEMEMMETDPGGQGGTIRFVEVAN